MGCFDQAIVLDGEDPREVLVDAAIQSVSTNVEITAGGVTLHLAAWMDPDHWSEDWQEALGEDADVGAFFDGLAGA
jgi:hypothetical protein